MDILLQQWLDNISFTHCIVVSGGYFYFVRFTIIPYATCSAPNNKHHTCLCFTNVVEHLATKELVENKTVPKEELIVDLPYICHSARNTTSTGC